MEDRRRLSLFNCVPSFAQGTDILLVHNDTLCLPYLSSLLRQCSFRVTATNQATAAIDMVCEQEGRFKLMIAKANMPDMDTISFLNTLLLKHITVIFISSGKNDGGAKAAFERGSCYLLQEPIHSEDLISVWQQVYNSNTSYLAQGVHAAKSKKMVHESSENRDKTHHDVIIVKRKRKREHNHAAEKEGEETRQHHNDLFPRKKPHISWTWDLHHKFVHAICILGEKNIHPTPRLIQEIMNVPYLTYGNISSHLQKFKARCLQDKCNGTKSASSIQRQCYPGYPTLAAFQNENQSQNHFSGNFPETKGPENFQMQENFSCQHQAELVNYGNQDLEAVVRGAVPDSLMDKNQYDNFGNGFTEDDSAQNSEIQMNLIFGNSFSPHNSAILGELEPCASMNQSQNLTEDTNILRITGGDSEGYDCFRRAKPCTFVGGHELIDQNKTSFTENDSVLSFLGEGHGQKSEMLRNSVLGHSFGVQNSDDYNPSCFKLLKSKIDDLKNQTQTSTEYNDISRFLLEEDCDTTLNSKILRNSVSGSSSDYCNNESVVRSCSVVGGSMPDALTDHDKTLNEHDNSRIFGDDDSDAYGCFGNTAPSSDDIATLEYAIFGDC